MSFGMPSTSSVVSETYEKIYVSPLIEKIAIFTIEFLLPGSLYSFGTIFSSLCTNLGLKVSEGLWFPLTAFSFWTITNCWSRRLCKYLKKRKYEKTAAFTFASILSLGKILVLFCKNNVIKFIIDGCITGWITSIFLALLKLKTPYYKERTKAFLTISHLSRAAGFIIIPLIFQILLNNLGTFGTQLLHGAVLFNVYPIALILIINAKERKLSNRLYKYGTITDNLYHKSTSQDENCDFWEINLSSEEEDEEDIPQNTKIITNTGVEVLSVIDELSESGLTNFTASFMQVEENQNIPEVPLKTHKYLYVAYALLYLSQILITKICTILIFALFVTLLPYLTNDLFILTITPAVCIIFILIFSAVKTTKTSKLAIYLLGLLISAIGFYLLSSFNYENATISAMLFGFVFAAILHHEQDLENILDLKNGVLDIIEVLSGINLLIIYSVLYVLSNLEIHFVFFLCSLIFSTNFLLWILLLVIKNVFL